MHCEYAPLVAALPVLIYFPRPVRTFLTSIALVAAVSGALVAGCGAPSSQGPLSYGESARRDFERAQQAVDDNDCLTATPLLQNVRREYPYSRYAALAELRLADCELAQQHYTEAIRGYRAFIRQRPTHPEVDTANFQVAVSYYRQIPSDFFLSPPPEERDQAATRSALRVVRRFLIEFPESEHVEEARRIERQVLALLARHELYVANYYLAHDRPQATIGRLRTLLDQYEGSGVEPEALLLLGRTHLHVRERRQARVAFGEVIERFPESGYSVQAREFLRMLDATAPSEAPSGEGAADGEAAGEGTGGGTGAGAADEEHDDTGSEPGAPGEGGGIDSSGSTGAAGEDDADDADEDADGDAAPSDDADD